MNSGKEWPTAIGQTVAKWRYRLRDSFTRQITVQSGDELFRLRCRSPLEELRAKSFYIKEEGTIQWIRTNVRQGEIFFDIGANVGLYSLMAAKLVGASGQVVAFEPHPMNVCSLLENISINGYSDRIKVISCALNDREGLYNFNLRSLEPGCAMNQLDSTIDSDGRSFRPKAIVGKYSCSLDLLLERNWLPPPHHIKIDVDGNEPLVLSGMSRLLSGDFAPRSIQIEVNSRNGLELERRLIDYGYSIIDRHFTFSGKRQLKQGINPELIAHNLVFSRNTSKTSTAT